MTMVDLVCVYMYIMQKKHRRMIIQREKRDRERDIIPKMPNTESCD